LKPINWDELFRRNAAQLKGLCRRYVGDPAVADDLVQETFITAIDKIETYRGSGSLDGWIRKIAVNKALLYLREAKPANVPVDTLTNTIEQESEMENLAGKTRYAIENASFSTDELLSVIDALPLHHKIVFNMYVIDGFSHSQIAQQMSISAGTSKSHLARARKKAQELLYAKASGKQPAETRRRSALLLLLFQPNYIDRIFRKGLGQFGLPLQTPNITFPPGTTLTLKWTATIAGKAALCGSAISIVAAGGFFAVQLAQQPSAGGVEPVQAEEVFTSAPVVKPVPDSLIIAAHEVQKPQAPAKVEKEKVIIRKTIVIRDTVRLERPASK